MSNNGSFNTNSYDGRYVQFNWSVASQNVANNNTTINWSISAVGGKSSWYKSNPTSVYINGNRVYYNGTRVQQYKGTIASGSYTISHDNNGNGSFNASVSSAIYSTAVNCNGSGSWGLPQIARYPVIQSASDFDDTGNPSLTFTNPSRLYPIRVKIEANGNTQLITRDIGNNATSYTFNLTESERNKLRKLTPNSNKLSVWLTVCAMNGNSELSASALGRTMTIVNANPTVEKNEYYDTNQKTTNITKDNQIIIRNNSKLEFKLTNLNALKYATLSKAEISLNGLTKSVTLSGSSVPSQIIDFGIVNSSSDLTASISVIDSRGNKTSYSKNVTIADWVQPSAIINCQRENNFYSTTHLTVDGSISSINDMNVMKIQYQYKKTTDTNYSALKTIQDNTQTSFDIDNNYAWDIRVIVSDLLGSTTYNVFVDKGVPLVYFDRLLSSMGLNCFPNEEKSFLLNGKNIYRSLFYSPGDVVSLNVTFCGGALSSGKTDLMFTIFLPKSFDDIESITIDKLKVNIRADGGYTLTQGYAPGGYDIMSDSTISLAHEISKKLNSLTIHLYKKSGTFNGKNNTAQAIEIDELQFTCN